MAGIHSSWDSLFQDLKLDPRMEKIESILMESDKSDRKIFPRKEDIFRVFQTPVQEIKVVILGQDPYIGEGPDLSGPSGLLRPQAMGLSFSVPKGFPKPPSLVNIFKNLKQFGHLDSIPESGDLSPLLSQGVFLLNSALTVEEGKSGSHKKIWTWMTDKVIQYIAAIDFVRSPVFILWGRDAIQKRPLILSSIRHPRVICSSHPSPLGASKPCGEYPAFKDCDFARDLDIDWRVLN